MDIEYSVEGHIAYLTINRPEKMNSVTDAMYGRAAEHAQFGSPEVKWAILHGYGALRLPEMVGMSNGLFLLLSGEFVDAQTALCIGLVSHVVPKDELAGTAGGLAERMAANGPLALQMSKELAYRGRELPLQDGLLLYQEYSRTVSASHHRSEPRPRWLSPPCSVPGAYRGVTCSWRATKSLLPRKSEQPQRNSPCAYAYQSGTT
jgi:enoyl-CoA hydratase/carnithine racemase